MNLVSAGENRELSLDRQLLAAMIDTFLSVLFTVIFIEGIRIYSDVSFLDAFIYFAKKH